MSNRLTTGLTTGCIGICIEVCAVSSKKKPALESSTYWSLCSIQQEEVYTYIYLQPFWQPVGCLFTWYS